MMTKCPNCSAEVEFLPGESEICSECGSELNAPSGVLPESLEDVKETGFSSTQNGASSSDFLSILTDAAQGSLAGRTKVIADNIESLDFDKVSESECHYLKVEYNRNLFFLVGSESIIKLRFTPLSDQLQDVLVFMETQREGNNIRRTVPVREVLQKNRSFYLQIPFCPVGIAGRSFFVFYIGCKTRNGFTYYQFSVEHKIYDSSQSSNAIGSQITINQKITSNQAADINYRDSIGEALKKMADKTFTVNEMIDRLNDLPPEYCVQKLVRTTWRPEDILIDGNLYPADKLLLEYDGKTIFLFNKESVKLGRDASAVDLVVRCGGGRLSPREYPNSTVSRKHAEILYCNDTVKLFDYSSYGTYINGRKPDSAGIPLEQGASIEFGDICWRMNIQKCYTRLPHNICQTCTANKIRSVTFSRSDSEPEYYLLIWQCCELGRVIEDLSDWTIFTRNGCFFIRTPEQNFYHLRPGQTVTSGDKQIKTRYFEQF